MPDLEDIVVEAYGTVVNPEPEPESDPDDDEDAA